MGKLENGTTVRIDSTVSAALMHQPSDSTLLWDAVRVMTRLLSGLGGCRKHRRCGGAIVGV
jgi:hypothetical protein